MDKPANILRLKYSRSSGLAATLENILDSKNDHSIKIYSESTPGPGSDSVECVERALSEQEPDIAIHPKGNVGCLEQLLAMLAWRIKIQHYH
jgi:hypothetical protein